MFDGLVIWVYAALIGIILTLGLGGYVVYDKFIRSKAIETHKPIKPSIKLHTDGKTIDTIYVYKF
jgi:hypothetical protein